VRFAWQGSSGCLTGSGTGPGSGALAGTGGSVVLVLASSVRVPLAELAVSNGLFPALAGVVKMLAEDLGPSGIRMNGILPVRIATERVRQLDALSGDPDEVRGRKKAGRSCQVSTACFQCSATPTGVS
jgi:NAD(P)-dependent dehydrogenase (short-subunit alcohol dehydrogenase family)